MIIGVEHYMIVSVVLFCLGLLGVIIRRNLIVMYMGLELMLNAANLNFIAFWRFGSNPELLHGPLFTLFTIAVAAAEVAVGLALVIAVYRHYRSVDLESLDTLKEE